MLSRSHCVRVINAEERTVKNRLIVAALGIFLATTCLFAQTDAYLPQVANGTYAGGSMRTTFILFNPTDLPDFVTLKLTDENGDPMVVTIPDRGADDEFQVIVMAGQTVILQTDGTGALKVGAALVERATGSARVAAIFTLYDTAQRFVTEAGVGASQLLTSFVIPVDATGQFNTGVALFNPGDTDASLTVQFLRSNGTQAASLPLTLRAGGHMAGFAAGPGSLFPSLSNIRGSLAITSSQPISAITLRQNGAPLSYTTLPVVSNASPQTSFRLPQVANGTHPSGLKMKTTFVLFNVSGSQANVNVTLRKQNGSALNVTIPDGVANNVATFSQSLAARGAAFLQTDGSGALEVGTAEVTSNVPIGVSAIFTLYTGDTFMTEAGVGDSEGKTALTLPVDISASFDTGVAFFNAENAATVITVRLLNSTGQVVATADPTNLAAKSQTAQFVSELFPGHGTFQGSLSITATGQVSAITLRQNSSPISYTTLPVTEGAYTSGGTATGTKLLAKSQTGVTATSNTTVNAALQTGSQLSGTVSGDVTMANLVVATASGGQSYSGPVNFLTRKYLIVLPAGTYTLRVCYLPQSVPLGSSVLSQYTDPTTVQVNADTTRDITVPAMTVSTVSGTVTGLATLPANAGVYIQMASSNLTVTGTADVDSNGSYQVQLPNGTYTVSLMILDLTTNQQDLLGFYNVGSVQVNGARTANFAVPAFSTLSGTVARTGANGMPAGSSIVSGDNTIPAVTTAMCNYHAGSSSGPIGGSDGAYSIHVISGRAQTVGITYPHGANGGRVMFPFPGRQVAALNGNRTESFTIPALPGAVSITGKVTNPQSQGVGNVSVSATTESVTGATGVMFTSMTTTDTNGNYTLSVLSGTNYTLTFAPPPPSQ